MDRARFWERCLLCSIQVFRSQRHKIDENEQILEKVKKRVHPREISSTDYLCHVCWNLVDQDKLDLIGRKSVCIVCGISIIRRKSRTILQNDMTKKATRAAIVISGWINRPLKTPDKVCCACWVRAMREINNQKASKLLSTPEPMVTAEPIVATDPLNREIKVEPLVTLELFNTSEPLQDSNKEKSKSLTNPEPMVTATPESVDPLSKIVVEPLVTSELLNTSDPPKDFNVVLKVEPFNNELFNSFVETQPDIRIEGILNQESDNSLVEVQSENQLLQLLQPARQQNNDTEKERQIRLPTIRRAAATSRRCFIANCTSRVSKKFVIPTAIRRQILAKLNFYLPKAARICIQHLNNYSFSEGCVARTDISTFTAKHIEDMIFLLREVNKIDFKYPELMDDHLFEYWFGMTKIKYTEILKKVPRINNKNLKLGLSALLCKKSTGDSNSEVASLFQLQKSTLETYMGKVRHILMKNNNLKLPAFW